MDSEYLCWLEINHPDSVPADRHILGGVSEDNPDVFSFVQPSSQLTMNECATSSNTPFLDSHESTTESAKTPPSLESIPHAESAKTPLTLESTPHASAIESAKTCPTPVMTISHTSAVGLAKMSPTLSVSVHSKTPVTTPSSTPSSAGTSSGESDPILN